MGSPINWEQVRFIPSQNISARACSSVPLVRPFERVGGALVFYQWRVDGPVRTNSQLLV